MFFTNLESVLKINNCSVLNGFKGLKTHRVFFFSRINVESIKLITKVNRKIESHTECRHYKLLKEYADICLEYTSDSFGKSIKNFIPHQFQNVLNHYLTVKLTSVFKIDWVTPYSLTCSLRFSQN